MATAKLTKAVQSEIEVLMELVDTARGKLADRLERLRDDWQAAVDERSDKWRESDAAEEAQGRIDVVDNWIGDLQEPIGDTIDLGEVS